MHTNRAISLTLLRCTIQPSDAIRVCMRVVCACARVWCPLVVLVLGWSAALLSAAIRYCSLTVAASHTGGLRREGTVATGLTPTKTGEKKKERKQVSCSIASRRDTHTRQEQVRRASSIGSCVCMRLTLTGGAVRVGGGSAVMGADPTTVNNNTTTKQNRKAEDRNLERQLDSDSYIVWLVFLSFSFPFPLVVVCVSPDASPSSRAPAVGRRHGDGDHGSGHRSNDDGRSHDTQTNK